MRFDGVGFRYGRSGPWVLRGVDAEVAAGQTVVLVGHNGAGKSTLLQLAVGVLRPSLGLVAGRPAAVGWVPERFPAEQPFTVGQYLTATARLRGLTAPAARRATETWLDRLGLGPYREVRLPAASKGTAQKVGLAQAVLTPPGLLVLDEPWEGLDAGTRELVPDIIAEVAAAGGAVLVSDHRGEVSRLPGAVRWTVVDGAVTASAGPVAAATVVVEVAVPAAAVADLVGRLRGEGHDVLRVRPAAGPVPDAPIAANPAAGPAVRP